MIKKIAIVVGQLLLALGASWGAARACYLTEQAEQIEPAETVPTQVVVTPELLKVIQAAAGAYKNEDTYRSIEITSDESVDAISRLFSRKVDIAVIGRPLSSAEMHRAMELKLELHTESLGWDGIGVWVHPSIARAMPSITLETLKQIFITGEIHHWEQIAPGKLQGRILPVTPPERSGVVEVFLEILDGNITPLSKQVRIAQDASLIPAIVLQNKQHIGLAPAMLHADGLAKLSIAASGEARRCGEAELRTGAYPLPLYVTAVTLDASQHPGRDFYRYLATVNGQQSLYAAGLTTALLPPPTPEAIPFDPHAAAPAQHGGGHGSGHGEAKEASASSGHH